MYAVVKDGGKQYKVSEGMSLLMDRRDLAVGQTFEFPAVLLFSRDKDVRVGTPTLSNVKVVGEVMGQEMAKKVIGIRYRAKKSSRRKRGFRAKLTRVRIKEIVAS
ncbi:MAG: 50S ribosomal protein L21 [Planctomycetes bacterium]|nr:50S ribosomal protein L21 [Planctomycetota bacterium]MBM4081990.1 50S ribosomal protein L21 [Planctomycetota bacterium]MBM4084723.1 50S ribosomal protein L21 [Planctomycetota bacterium]